MVTSEWAEEFGAAITVCDENGVIVEANQRSRSRIASGNETAVLGMNMLDCHPEPARSKVVQMLKTEATNVYTIEKNGRRKLVYQAPWYKDGHFAGLVELSLPLPDEMPHFNRDKK
ncbi:MAG TPA: PAS domain-containing protein [Anaerolineae bacterium]|mgnify:FL=1|nr:PAS domain-containing protein [Anaerolineae bacterium]HNT06322.1 PAS domain-containing protein [Anaerolineae bacterium]